MKNRMILVTGLCLWFAHGTSVAVEDKNISVASGKKVVNKEFSVSDMMADRSIKLDAHIMFVETFAVMGEGDTGKIARKEIEAKRDLAAQQIQEESKKFEKAKAEYISKASTMSDSAREKEEKKIIKMERDLKNLVAEKEEELKLDMQTATEKLAQEMEVAVVELAQQEDIDIVFDKMTGRAIYVAPAFDFTDKVIDRVNEKHQIKVAQNKKAEATIKVADNKKISLESAKAGA